MQEIFYLTVKSLVVAHTTWTSLVKCNSANYLQRNVTEKFFLNENCRPSNRLFERLSAMNLCRRILFLAMPIVFFLVSIADVHADPAANNPIGKMLPLAIGFILLAFFLGSLPYLIVTFAVAIRFKRKNNKFPNFSFWMLHALGFIVWWLIWVSLFYFVWKK
jgi:hypothetical protein